MKDNFPNGRVTLLFTDIEGSTRLLARLGESYADVLTQHRELLHTAFQAHNGQEVSWQGDSSFVVFAQPQQAVAAARDAQRALSHFSWPPNGAVRVRMGLHTGQPTRSGNDFIGVDVHHAARLMAAASGGQVLLSNTVLDAINDDWPTHVKVLLLGRHQLKDIEQTENIAQLLIDDIPSEFPPIKAIDLRPNNLPSPVTPLVGRKRELSTAAKLLQNPTIRLLTFTGTGGAGKTRLSLQVASNLMGTFEDGVFFVALAAVRKTDQAIAAIAQTLEVKEVAGKTLVNNLSEYLRAKQLLLVLDNFEQVVEAAQSVAELLANCPRIKVLVTSRMALNVRGEHEFPVPPLELPDLECLPLLKELSHVPSINLFTQRAQAVKPSFILDAQNSTAIATICHRLEGSPLAIELAAPHLKKMPSKVLLSRLENSLTLLTEGQRDLPERHQTLRECIAWSYNLLQSFEQKILGRLSVFAGGFTLEAVEAATREKNEPSTKEAMEMLERMNLIKRIRDDEPRFIMLERIREFALEQLAASENAATWHHRHAHYFLQLAQQAGSQLAGKEQSEWLQRLDQEQHNLRTALGWTLEFEAETALKLAGALWPFWENRGWINEGRQWFREILEKNANAPAELRASALSGAGKLAWHSGDYNAAAQYLETSLALYRQLGDKQGIATSLSRLGLVTMHQGDLDRTQLLFEEGLEIRRKLHDKAGSLQLLVELQEISLQCDPAGLRTLSAEGLQLARELGDKRSISGSVMNVGFVAHGDGHYDEAQKHFSESLHIARELGETWYITHALYALGKTLTANGKWKEAFPYMQESLAMTFEHKFLWGIPYVIATHG